jgi:mono/diheme cytochrome c family protein
VKAAILFWTGWALAQQDPAAPEFFSEVRPLLAVHCHKCHAGDAAKGGLRLDSLAAALKGGDGGPALVPGKPLESPLYQRVASHDRKERMPAKAEPLPEAERHVLRHWIAAGAPWPTPAEAAKAHWAFRPLRKPAVPAAGAGWARSPVDAFIAAAQQAAGVKPSPEADPRTLRRRLSLDLTGLPPAPGDDADVERLLASPAYGERWGRHWLDLARFAETTGYEGNLLRPSAWRYRDWVVRAFNDDTPYDRFLRDQLAGDEQPDPSDDQLVATGFLAHGRLDNNQEDRVAQRNDHLVDIANAAAAVSFGLSFACAQCHEHKWDPITHEDYYRFMGFFVRGQVVNLKLKDPAAWAAWEKTETPELRDAKAYRATLKKSPEDARLVEELDKKIARLEKARPDPPHAWGFYGPHTGPNTLKTYPIQGQYPMPYDAALLRQARPRLLRRGDPHQPGPELGVGWPEVFGPTPKGLGATSPRTALADWLTRPDHPTVARVFVNFVWLRHFGRGLVETPLDFGLRGAKPTHPELLDWLAADFIEHGWSVKHLQRRIVNSATYRQASRAVDVPDRLYARWTPRRLEAEAIRDSLLAVSGELDRRVGGPSVEEAPRTKKSDYSKEPTFETTQTRRSLYYVQRRHEFPSLQSLFDGPRAEEACARRNVSTVSLQPLYLLNNAFVVDRAKAFAARIRGAVDVVGEAFELALGRAPGPAERADAEAFLARGGPALEHFAQVLFNLNEFAYVD